MKDRKKYENFIYENIKIENSLAQSYMKQKNFVIKLNIFFLAMKERKIKINKKIGTTCGMSRFGRESFFVF